MSDYEFVAHCFIFTSTNGYGGTISRPPISTTRDGRTKADLRYELDGGECGLLFQIDTSQK